MAINNAGGNKLDAYLERRASYSSTTNADTGETVGTLRVELTNAVPMDAGLPSYVIGNAVGLPEGTSRLYVSFYSSLPLDAATRDGSATQTSPGHAGDWNVYSQFVDIPPGATVAYELQFVGHLDRPDALVTWTQPLAAPLEPLG